MPTSQEFFNTERLTQRNLNAAERAHLAQQGLEDQLKASLADAGTVSLPGIEQGAQTAGARRVAERVAIPFAQELRENTIQESELADRRAQAELANATQWGLEQDRLDLQERGQEDARELNALQLATGWSKDQATRVLNAAAVGTDRQRILSEVALGTLDRNITWNKFLFDAGIQREQLANDIQNGRMDRIGAILQGFSSFLAQLRGGFIGND